jgi:hypothetical protein
MLKSDLFQERGLSSLRIHAMSAPYLPIITYKLEFIRGVVSFVADSILQLALPVSKSLRRCR